MAYLDVCRWIAHSSGTGDFVDDIGAVTGYQNMASAGAINLATYYYRAESADLSLWEVGFGVYTVSTTTLSRSTVLFNSSGTTAKISFLAAPQVAIVALAEQLSATAFYAHKDSTNQTGLNTSAYNLVTWPVEANDVGGFFDTTNSWWTPPAGYVALSVGVFNSAHAASTGTPVFVIKIQRAHSAITISNASPGVVTWPAHGLAVNRPLQFSTTGALPTGLTAGWPTSNVYYVKTVIDANTFTVAATLGGAVINTSSAGSGVHTGYCDVVAALGGGWLGAPGFAYCQAHTSGAYSNGTDHFLTIYYFTSDTPANDGTIDGNPAHTQFSGHWIGP